MVPAVFEVPPLHHCIHTSAAPLTVFQRLYAADRFAFLYESLEGDGTRGRYSFAGGRPRLVFRSKGPRITFRSNRERHDVEGNPFDTLRQLIGHPVEVPAVAPFPGGAVGYFAYDMVRFCEEIPDEKPDDPGLPDSYFIFPEEVIAFDHVTGDVHLLIYQAVGAVERVEQLERCLLDCDQRPEATLAAQLDGTTSVQPVSVTCNTTEADFHTALNKAKEYIYAGDVLQVVLSRRFEFHMAGRPLDLYKALRCTNPSPYMYYLNLGHLQVLGSSPEILVRLQGNDVITRPLAGTRPRGKTAAEDEALARELLSDEKERAEHVMLVDLARNDIGRVCTRGSVRTTELLQIERYSRVMHLVSHVEGRLARGCDAIDVLQATFPAGTVSGAPKVRAMQIIEELEPVKRGVYAGAIGYLSLLGEMDMCIGIRTIVLHGRRGFIQAGAGIVADSVARHEHYEILNKAKGMMKAVSEFERSP